MKTISEILSGLQNESKQLADHKWGNSCYNGGVKVTYIPENNWCMHYVKNDFMWVVCTEIDALNRLASDREIPTNPSNYYNVEEKREALEHFKLMYNPSIGDLQTFVLGMQAMEIISLKYVVPTTNS